MSKTKTIVGVDVSKDTLDVYSEELGSLHLSNDMAGFKTLLGSLESVDVVFIMEATGVYHLCLANYLYAQGFGVSVLNPLIIKRYIQMKLHHVKTDKSDAKMIAGYGIEQGYTLWEPTADYIREMNMILSSIELYQRQSTMLKNKLHSLERGGIKKGKVFSSLRRQLRHIKTEIKQLEGILEEVIKSEESELYTHLQSIPGVGKKTASLLIASTNGFRNFESAKQLSSYFGVCPNQRSSGSSIRGKSRITKAGSARVRNHLFLCSFTASRSNPQCAALYTRLVNKGKSKKLALIAVTNKLLKQMYAISKSGVIYDPKYRSQLN